MERIGRLKERYGPVAQYYEVKVKKKRGIATNIEWKIKEEKIEEHFSGTYFLRTPRTDLGEKELWSIYRMLTNVEEAFRYLKSDLKLHPICQGKS